MNSTLPPTEGAVDRDLSLRLLGGMVDAGVPTIIAGTLSYLDSSNAWFAGLGIAAGFTIGFGSAPNVVATAHPIRLALKLAVVAPAVGVAYAVLVMLAASQFGRNVPPDMPRLVAALFPFIYGAMALPLAYVYGLPLTLATGILASAALRRAALLPRGTGLSVASIPIIAVATLAGPALAGSLIATLHQLGI